VIDGIMFRFTDTAGLRDTTDIIENHGIKKTHEKNSRSQHNSSVADINEGISSLFIVAEKHPGTSYRG
jgi:tRNA U34 5-carboxymethylaminomethyl modifying GTPase MnmE/TrmE